MEVYLQRAQKIIDRIDELAAISEDDTSITRIFATEAFIRGRDLVESWFRSAGLETRIDNIGNIRGRLSCNRPGSKTFVIASHIDTVVNAGKWDGPVGVIAGLDLLDKLVKDQSTLPFNVELIAFSDEEGVRFHTTLLGSKVVTGSFDESLLEKTDFSGTTLKEAIEAMNGRPADLKTDAFAPGEILGYFEMHIEQGPVLYENRIPAAVVSSIAGQRRIEITFRGMAGHAGTVPMNMRSDALCCAAACIVETERYALLHKDTIVATVGTLHIVNAASNVIPGEVVCTLDARSADECALENACRELQALCNSICSQRNIGVEWQLVQQTAPVTCDPALNSMLSRAISEAGIEIVTLVSGAGHDAIPVSVVAPVSMLFVRCYKGISHNPLEDVEVEDLAASLQVSDLFIQNLLKTYQ
jgi:allantoate deiminase